MGDYLETDTEKLLSLIEKTVSRYKMNIKFLFRPHPACNLNVQSYSKLNLEIARGSFFEILECCDLAICSSKTSSAVDAYYMGIPVASFLDGECLNLSPLRDEKKSIRFFYLEEELRNILMDFKERANLTQKTSNFFYINDKLPKWKKLLLSNLGNGIDEA